MIMYSIPFKESRKPKLFIKSQCSPFLLFLTFIASTIVIIFRLYPHT